jgi:YidC/Oxa1 family membrane protein insertase
VQLYFLPGEILQDSSTLSNPFIPEQPIDSIASCSDLLQDAADAVNSLGEPTLASLGLGGSTPIGLVQHTLDLVHTYFDLPWVWTIVAVTVGFRFLMFPLIVKSQANAARLNNIKPQLEELQSQLRELMNTNDAVGKATATLKMKQLYKDNNCHPVKVPVVIKILRSIFLNY